MAEPLLIEIITYAPTAYYHCKHCEVAWREAGVSNHVHDEQVQSSLPADLTREYQILSDWVQELFRRYCDRVLVHVIDAASFEGVLNSLRYGTRRYPAVVIDRQARFTGSAVEVFKRAGAEVERRLGEVEAESQTSNVKRGA